jgi:hypothetical protein
MELTQEVLMNIALGGLAVSLALFASAWLYPHLRKAWDKATAFARAAFCGAVAVACLYGGAKHGGSISYPKTDTDVAYLVDAGSYVTNDAVHVAFTRVPTVPDSATFYLDYCALDGTNSAGVATNWVNAKTATFADLEVPFDFAFAAATNYNWVAYTDWTPGPAVQTNGVWHAYWGLDKKTGSYIIPVRTCVRADGEVIATPKSKWDAAMPTPNSYVQDGLIAMWDGEWNAGRGVHDSAATVWKDLVGTRDLAIESYGNYWEENCAYNWGNTLTDHSSTASIDEARAIECVYMQTADNPAYAGLLVWNGITDTDTGRVSLIHTRFHGGETDGLQVGHSEFAYFDTSTVYNRIYTFTGQRSVCYRNAVGFETKTMSADGWGGSGFSFGGRGGSGYNAFGRFYCVRVYNRELTAEEVAHNYAIDKARFGSGNE